MKPVKPLCFSDAVFLRRTPVALAVLLIQGFALAQPALNTTSADVPEAKSLFETGGQQGIGPRPFTSFLERLSSPVEKIAVKVEGENLPADGVSATNVQLQLLGKDGQRMTADADVTIEVDGGARVLLPGRMTSESGADRGDIDRITPGVQQTVKNGVLQFKLIAPFKPDPVTLKVSVRGVTEKVIVRYVPDLREFIAVGLLSAIPTIEFMSWRKALKAGQVPTPSERKITMIRQLLHGELMGVVIILLCAAVMARGGFV